MNPRRLYRSRRERQLAGVAGGIAEYLEVDPTVVRILWLLSILLGGFGILLYIVMAFVVPLDPRPGPTPGPWQPPGPGGTIPPAGDAGPDGADTDKSQPAGPTWGANPAWAYPAATESNGRGGRGGLIVGIMLIVFGSIALTSVLLPGWAIGLALGPALLVALGVALLVVSARRTTSEP